jgi:hypothetical protein
MVSFKIDKEMAMTRFKLERIIGTGALLAAALGLAQLPGRWVACGAAVLIVMTVLPAVAVALLVRAINGGSTERPTAWAASRSFSDAPQVVLSGAPMRAASR